MHVCFEGFQIDFKYNTYPIVQTIAEEDRTVMLVFLYLQFTSLSLHWVLKNKYVRNKYCILKLIEIYFDTKQTIIKYTKIKFLCPSLIMSNTCI